MSGYSDKSVEHMRARAEKAKLREEDRELSSKIAMESDPVKKAKLRADRAGVRASIGHLKTRAGHRS